MRADEQEAAGQPTDSQLRELIRGYLGGHPTAMDTLDGIAGWWVARRRIEIEVRRVSRVLEEMVRDGELETCEQDGVSFFHRRGRGPVAGPDLLDGEPEP